MTAAHRERGRLRDGLVALDPHHLGARHHHLAGGGITEFEHRLDHPAFVVGHDATFLCHVDDFAQFDLRGERAVAESLTGGQRVTDQDEQAA